MVEVLAVVLGVGVLVLAYVAFGAQSAKTKAADDARAHEADATVNRVRAERFKKLIESLGEDVEEVERREEAAHGGRVGPAVDRFNARVRGLRGPRTNKGGQGSGGGDSGVPPS